MEDGFGWCLFLGAVSAGMALLYTKVSQDSSSHLCHPLPIISEKAGACSSHGNGRDSRSCMETRKTS